MHRFGRHLSFLIPVLLVLLGGCDLVGSEDGGKAPPPPKVNPVDQSPAWSPDGRRIAYVHDAVWTEDPTDVTGLYVLDLEADSTWLVVEGQVTGSDWRPNGERVAFAAGDIFSVRADGSDLQQLVRRGRTFAPSWAPDGRRIAYDMTVPEDSSGTWLINPDGSGKKHLDLGREPDWNATGTQLVYEGPPGPSERSPQLWVADTSRADSTQLTANDFVDNRDPAWSPDGEWIAWTPLLDDGRELRLVRADGTGRRKLADEGREPTWGPHSERIVFAKPARESDLTALWTIRRDGSDLRQLTAPSRNPMNE